MWAIISRCSPDAGLYTLQFDQGEETLPQPGTNSPLVLTAGGEANMALRICKGREVDIRKIRMVNGGFLVPCSERGL